MKKCFILILLIIPLVYALEECKPVMDIGDFEEGQCRVTTTWNYTPPCNNYNVTVLDENGSNIINYTMGNFSSGLCNFTWNISSRGSYQYIVPAFGETGNIKVEANKQMISFGVIIFLLTINLVVFIIPFVVKNFSQSEAGTYVIKRLIWIVALIFLWFNTTILRTLASDFGLDIDNFLVGYWWFFTFSMFIIVFFMVYVMVVGATKLMKEAQMQRRMGNDNDE